MKNSATKAMKLFRTNLKPVAAAFVLTWLSTPATAHAETVAQARQRVLRSVMQKIYVKDGPLGLALSRRRENADELQRLLFASSPDLNAIGKLRQRDYELSVEITRLSHEATEAAIRQLDKADQLIYLQSLYPQPALVSRPD